MEKILEGISKAICYLDDILITDKDDSDHLLTLEKVFDQLNQWGLHLKKKCELLKQSVLYLGYRTLWILNGYTHLLIKLKQSKKHRNLSN